LAKYWCRDENSLLPRILELNPGLLSQARRWIGHHREFCQGSLDSLADYLERGMARHTSQKTKRARK